MRLLLFPIAAFALLLGCADRATDPAPAGPDTEAPFIAPTSLADIADPDTAVFAGGCFWCMETAYEGQEGIGAVISGFAGGTVANPSYNQVVGGGTGHYEVVQIIYDPEVISYETLLDLFWTNVDPFDDGGQFCDRGDSYRPALFADAEQRPLAEASLEEVATRFDQPIVVPILDAAPFYAAEDYHQDFWLKDPDRYYSYRTGCRRDERLRAIWGDEAGPDATAVVH